MPLYLVTELNNRVVLCYPEGDKELYCNYETAQQRATFISANNSGVFQIQRTDQIDRRFRWMRAITNTAGKITHYTGDAFGPMGE